MIADLRQQFNDAKQAFQTNNAVDLALKKELLAATDERFVLSLRDRTHGFALVRTRTIIAHLLTNYGTILSVNLSTNDERLRVTWSVTTPIELLFAQIDDGAAYATAGASAYTDTQLVRFGYNLVAATSRMELACRDWRLKPEAEKTWAYFKIHFKAAHIDLRIETTTSLAGFRANHAATDNNALDQANEDADTGVTQAYLANLTEAQIANNAQVTALATTIQQLQAQLAAATIAINAVQNGNNRRRNPRNNRNNGNNQGGDDDAAQRYCWTHGGRVAEGHNSHTCSTRADGHQVLATFLNRMGGSNRFCPAAP